MRSSIITFLAAKGYILGSQNFQSWRSIIYEFFITCMQYTDKYDESTRNQELYEKDDRRVKKVI